MKVQNENNKKEHMKNTSEAHAFVIQMRKFENWWQTKNLNNSAAENKTTQHADENKYQNRTKANKKAVCNTKYYTSNNIYDNTWQHTMIRLTV